jgi:chromosomal replication initiation ATPase DnaA
VTTTTLKKEIADLETQKTLLKRLRALRNEVHELRIESLGKTDDARVITRLSEEVCADFRLDQAALLGKSRQRPVVVPRFALHWLAFHAAKLSLSAVARVLGCDHGTVSNGIRGCQDLMDTREDFKVKMVALRERCKPLVLQMVTQPKSTK